MRNQVILVAVVALVAGVVGGYIGSSAGGTDGSAHASNAAPSDATEPVATPALRSVGDELKLIEARGGWELRRAMIGVAPITLEVGSETIIHAPKLSWKPGETLDVDYQFFRLTGSGLERVVFKKE